MHAKFPDLEASVRRTWLEQARLYMLAILAAITIGKRPGIGFPSGGGEFRVFKLAGVMLPADEWSLSLLKAFFHAVKIEPLKNVEDRKFYRPDEGLDLMLIPFNSPPASHACDCGT